MTKKSPSRLARDAAKKAGDLKELEKLNKLKEQRQLDVIKSKSDKALKELEEFYANNKTWDDLENNIFRPMADMLYKNSADLVGLLSTPRLVEFMHKEGFGETLLRVKTIQKDFEDFAHELLAIHRLHEGKTGNAKDAEEMSECISIFGKYDAFKVKYFAIIEPNWADISVTIGKAMQEMEKADAQNPNIITDVIAKEA